MSGQILIGGVCLYSGKLVMVHSRAGKSNQMFWIRFFGKDRDLYLTDVVELTEIDPLVAAIKLAKYERKRSKAR